MTTISDVIVDVIERDPGSLKVLDERSDIGGKTTQGILRIRTDDGHEGNAFIGDQAANSSKRIEIIIKTIAPQIIGMPYDNREWLWSQIEQMGDHKFPIHASWAAVDVALWDPYTRPSRLVTRILTDSLERQKSYSQKAI